MRDIAPKLDYTETCWFANICGSTVEEYAEVTRRFDDTPMQGMEINISCPNVREGGVAFGNDPTCRHASWRPAGPPPPSR